MPQCKRKKDGKTEYRSTYRWKDENGVVHQTTTPWMSSKLEADQLANKLSSTKNLPTNRNKQNKKVGVVFDEYIQYVEKEAFDSRLKNKSSLISLYQRLNTINNQYFPKELQNTIVKDVNPSFFRSWLDSLNRKQMSGETLRTYKSAIQKFNKYLADMGYSIEPKRSGIKLNFDVLHHGVPVAYLEAAGVNILNDDKKSLLGDKLTTTGLFKVSCRDSDLEGVFMACFCVSRAEFF